MTTRNAVGIIRVSQTGGREGERFVSPDEQRDRIEAACKRDGLTLLEVHEELDISGGKPLADRPGLNAAVEAIEAGRAHVVVAAYFDRLVRSLAVQRDVVQRVEDAGGQVLALDFGKVTEASAAQWLSGTVIGAMSEYFRRSAKERSAEGQARAVARGAIPWAHVPVGYKRRDDGTIEPDPATVPIARKAFEMRADQIPVPRIREMLAENGIKRSPRGVATMLASRTYLGEIHYGQFVNLDAHEAIIERELWDRVQRVKVPRGPSGKSNQLLARQGILRCGTCGSRMTAAIMPQGGGYPIYRCHSGSDCTKRVVIAGKIADQVVTDAVRERLQGEEEMASVADNARALVVAFDKAQEELDAALRSFVAAGLEAEPAAIERLGHLRDARDTAREHVDQVQPDRVVTVNANSDWDTLTQEEQRDLIRATVRSAVVAPDGRGASRIRVDLFD